MDKNTASDRDMLTNEMCSKVQEAERRHQTQAAELKEQLAKLITANAHLAAANAQLVAANSQLTAENRGLKATVPGRNAADRTLQAYAAMRSAAPACREAVDASTQTEGSPAKGVRPSEAKAGGAWGLEWEANRIPTKPRSCLAVAADTATTAPTVLEDTIFNTNTFFRLEFINSSRIALAGGRQDIPARHATWSFFSTLRGFLQKLLFWKVEGSMEWLYMLPPCLLMIYSRDVIVCRDALILFLTCHID
ncbi:hypothetical protein PG997_007124 [Apiospora hydei]|uniref:Uncharacterized protein n=1 Tax=Apiospora hydei TaxID=1337664 RepID=A0ABR1WR17_9PEZI